MPNGQHSKWGASRFEQLVLCPGSAVMQAGAPAVPSRYAAEGTAAHQVLTWALQEGRQAEAYVGRVIEADGFSFEVDAEMAEHVQVCVDYVRAVAGAEGAVLVDTRVDYSAALGLPAGEAFGTLDVAVLLDSELIVLDFKYGRGVEVAAAGNPQLQLYAIGVLAHLDFLAGGIEHVRLVISQPRITRAPIEWDTTRSALYSWAAETAADAVRAVQDAEREHLVIGAEQWAGTHLRAGEKQCRFCAAKPTCPALRDSVAAHVFDARPATPGEFANLAPAPVDAATDEQWLAASLRQAELVEAWCASVRAEAERRLLAGQPVPGFKLVQGRRGPRQWADEAAVEAYLRETARLPERVVYDMKLRSPAALEKLARAGTIGPRQWEKLSEKIVQKDGAPHVAPDSDPRPAIDIRPVVEDFRVIKAGPQEIAS